MGYANFEIWLTVVICKILNFDNDSKNERKSSDNLFYQTTFPGLRAKKFRSS